MHDAVAGSNHIGVWEGIKSPCQHTPQRFRMECSACRVRPYVLKERRVVGVVHRDASPFPEHLHQPGSEHQGIVPVKLEEREFDRGRPSIEAEDVTAHSAASFRASGATALQPLDNQWA